MAIRRSCQFVLAPESLWAWVCSVLDPQDSINELFKCVLCIWVPSRDEKRRCGQPLVNPFSVSVGKKPEAIEVPPPSISKELKKRWSHFIQKVYETDPLICPKCRGEMRIISFIDQRAVIKKILEHLGLWEEAHAPPDSEPPKTEITFDPSYSQLI